MTAGSKQVRCLRAQAAQRVALGASCALERLLVASLDGLLLRLLELLRCAEQPADVDLVRASWFTVQAVTVGFFSSLTDVSPSRLASSFRAAVNSSSGSS